MQHIVFNETVVDKTFGQQKSSCCLHPYEIYVGLLIVMYKQLQMSKIHAISF